MDYYQILGVSKHATNQQIKRAYETKISDANLDASSRRLITEAYETLIDANKRRDYDSINDNMKIRTTTTTYHSGNEEDIFNFSTKTRVIPKWKIYLTLFAIFAVALLFVVLLIWGFVQLLPIIIFIILLVLIYKLIKQLRGK